MLVGSHGCRSELFSINGFFNHGVNWTCFTSKSKWMAGNLAQVSMDLGGLYIYIYIYIPGTQMTLVLIGKGLVLGGWPTKIEVIGVPGIRNIYIYMNWRIFIACPKASDFVWKKFIPHDHRSWWMNMWDQTELVGKGASRSHIAVYGRYLKSHAKNGRTCGFKELHGWVFHEYCTSVMISILQPPYSCQLDSTTGGRWRWSLCLDVSCE